MARQHNTTKQLLFEYDEKYHLPYAHYARFARFGHKQDNVVTWLQ